MNNPYLDSYQSLKKRKEALEQELKQLDIALSALYNITVDNSSIINRDNAIQKQKVHIELSMIKQQSEGSVSNAYNKDLTYAKKIEFVLSTMGSATVKDIVDYIKGAEGINEQSALIKLHNGIAFAASNMNVKGELNTRRIGKAYAYSLKSTDDSSTNLINEMDDLYK